MGMHLSNSLVDVNNIGGVTDFNFIHLGGIFTICFWLDPTIPTTGSSIRLLTTNNYNTGQPGFLLYLVENGSTNDGDFRLIIASSSASSYDGSTTGDYVDDTLHHYAMVGDGTDVDFYKDGGNIQTPAATIGTGYQNQDQSLEIADGNLFASGRDFFLGDLRIYNTNLTSEQIQTIYHSKGGDIMDTTNLKLRMRFEEESNGAAFTSPDLTYDESPEEHTGGETGVVSPSYEQYQLRI